MNSAGLKLQLLSKYKLNDVYIVNYLYDYAELKEKLGKAAVAVFEQLIEKYDTPSIGIGGGSTIYNLINALKFRPRNIKIFPTALIGRGPEVNHVDSTFLATLLYLKSRPHAKAFVVNIPPLPRNKILASEFLQYMLDNIEEVKWLYDEMCNVDIAFIGLGAAIPTGDFDDEMNKLGLTLQNLQENGVVGGINYNWFKNDGTQFGDYFLTIPIAKLISLSQSKNKHMVLIAGGTHKIGSVEIAVSHGMVNTLITDSLTAQKLLGRVTK